MKPGMTNPRTRAMRNHHDEDHSPEDLGLAFHRPVRPYVHPRNLQALKRRRFLPGLFGLMPRPFRRSLLRPRRTPVKFVVPIQGGRH